ncbi:hypothetical protein [Flavobacterium sp. SM2513]|uniref:hypothetical protein n=1 Tax=Flavobacterium sp. SM2513 TaxID=3424766 RepID=UPI003D7F5B34
MDTVKLEKQMRIVPLICVVAMLLLRQFTEGDANPIWTIISIVLGLLALASFFFKMYLEKKNGTFIAKRYYVFYFFIIISMAMLVYNLLLQ